MKQTIFDTSTLECLMTLYNKGYNFIIHDGNIKYIKIGGH